MNGELELTTMVEMEEGRRPKEEDVVFPQLLARLHKVSAQVPRKRVAQAHVSHGALVLKCP
ncbi:hypothetical protein LR48_Vigan2463s000100 [Vigna angularis]|nr:hypothetical protein LR48_Vigan2463s000100 [Vigna angularis]